MPEPAERPVLGAIVAVRPGRAVAEPYLGLAEFSQVALPGSAAEFPARLWRQGALLLASVGVEWCLLLTENFDRFLVLDWADFAEPALVCLREQVYSPERRRLVRHDWDWYQAGTTFAERLEGAPPVPHKALRYSETSDTSYGDLGAMCLPTASLLNLTLDMASLGWEGANIELSRVARNAGLPVKLGKTTIKITEK